MALEQTGERRDEGGKSAVTEEHLNLFTLEDSSEKKGNAEYHREKKEEKVSNPTILHNYCEENMFLILKNCFFSGHV